MENDTAAAAAGESLLPAAAAAPAAAGTPGDGAAGSLLATPPAAATGDDWLPEKFRVMADGKLDEGASARKMAESYKALEAHKGALPQAPAKPEDYTLQPPNGADGKPMLAAEDFEQFTKDPLFQTFTKDAHAAGLTNDQLQFVVGRYLNMAPQLLQADQSLTLEEARAELETVWTTPQAMQENLAGVVVAINGFGAEAEGVPGSRARLMEKYGRDPDFIAFAAAVASEMKEDRLPSSPAIASEADVDSLQKSKAYWDKNDPDHGKVKAQVDAFYTRKHGTKRR